MKKKETKSGSLARSEKFWDSLIIINLFMAIFIYLPILAPWEAYTKANSFIFFIGLINLMVLSLMLQFKSLSKEKTEKEDARGKVVSFYRK